MLVGRDPESAQIARLLDRARAGQAGLVAVTGEAGMGKTALLDQAAAHAGGMTVARTVGLEAEAQLEFSALFDICRPLWDSVGELPDSQAAALANALGIGPGPPGDRFLVGAATLSLLAAAAQRAPLLVLIDDAQWIDAASEDALLFAARRLVAEPVAMIVAAREEESAVFGGGALETIRLQGIDERGAATLLAARGAAGLAPDVAERVWRATGGNPLALLELPTLLSARQLRGLEPIEEPVPVGDRLRQAFARRALDLPEDAQQALLVAALSSSGGLEAVLGAMRLLSLDERALEQAEDAGLISVTGSRMQFRYPLVRSAVVQTAAASARRRAHRALAETLAERSPDARAWHLAAAALGPDEEAASALAEAAVRTRARSGWPTAALALMRAAELTRDPRTRQHRLLDAAESAWVGGRIELTLALTDELLAHDDRASERAPVVRLRSQMELHCGDVRDALEHLLEGAGLLSTADPEPAVAMLADAVEAAELLDEPQRALEAADRAAALASGDGEAGFVASLALGQALRLAGRPEPARPHLEHALVVLAAGDELQASMRACTRGAHAAGWLGRVPEALRLARRAVEVAREQGAFGPLAHALEVTAALDASEGRWRDASAHASEGVELARSSRCAWAQTRCLEHLASLDAVQGRADACRAHAGEALAAAEAAGFTSDRARAALGLLQLGLGQADEAARSFETIGAAGVQRRGAGDLLEALARSGRAEEARRLPAPEDHAVAERCAGLLATDAAFEAAFLHAIELHGEHDRFGLARTRLCFGERLRRAGRRVDARVQLRAAHEDLEGLEARPWADRAAAELRATGERLGRRAAREGDELTPQELQVALQAAEGKTNKEIGAALFLSPKTVDFHLRRVFRKRDVRSRGELIRQFAASAR